LEIETKRKEIEMHVSRAVESEQLTDARVQQSYNQTLSPRRWGGEGEGEGEARGPCDPSYPTLVLVAAP
jgi:hypothetical protein